MRIQISTCSSTSDTTIRTQPPRFVDDWKTSLAGKSDWLF